MRQHQVRKYALANDVTSIKLRFYSKNELGEPLTDWIVCLALEGKPCKL